MPTLIEKYRISHVFIAAPMNRYHEARKVFDVLSQTLAEVRLVADVPEMAAAVAERRRTSTAYPSSAYAKVRISG
ncbi:MAG: hypothetical protein U0744_05490 [Gemmataceae bacterium]